MKIRQSNRKSTGKCAIKILMVATAAVFLCGCNSFLRGAAGGAAGAGAGYELSARQQLKQLDKDLEAGRIDQEEYEIRKNQIERGSIIY
ncbi:MAG: hypothetical protein ACOCUY_01840 [Verrucomicrobiota bacterium]